MRNHILNVFLFMLLGFMLAGIVSLAEYKKSIADTTTQSYLDEGKFLNTLPPVPPPPWPP